MDNNAPITWIINNIQQLMAAKAYEIADILASTISPLAASCFGIYMILISVNYMRGAESEPVLDFMLRMAAWALIIGLGLAANGYTSNIMPILIGEDGKGGIGMEIADKISGGTSSSGTLDELAKFYFMILSKGHESSTAYTPGGVAENLGLWVSYFMKFALICLGLIPFLVAATLVNIVASAGTIMVAMVGPIFFAFLLFPATRQYFSAWLNTAFSYALIPIFVAVVSSFSVTLSRKMFIDEGGTLDDASLYVVFFASIGNLILLFLLKQVSALASSLSAGGINAAMPGGGIGSLAKGISRSASETGKGLKQAHEAGKAVKAGAAAAYNHLTGGNTIRKAG
jgi:type IV secretion system protein VirB6